MARKRYKPEELVAKLRQVDVLTAQGMPVADVIRSIGVTDRQSEHRSSFEGGGQITAIERYRGGIYLYSLYPELEFGVFTKHSHLSLDKGATSWTYYGACHFSGAIDR